MTQLRRGAAVLAIVLVAAACGSDSTENPTTTTNAPGGAAGTCLEGTADCDDTPFGSDAPDDLRVEDPSSPMVVGDGLTVSEALSTDAAGPLAVGGFVVDDGTGPRLCEALAESFPPQCGGASIQLADLSTVDPDALQTAQDVTWSDQTVIVLGDIRDGILVPDPLSK